MGAQGRSGAQAATKMKDPEPKKPIPDTRLIERRLPIVALGIESTRERTPMTPFPAPSRLRVGWARRALVASRAVPARYLSMGPKAAGRRS